VRKDSVDRHLKTNSSGVALARATEALLTKKNYAPGATDPLLKVKVAARYLDMSERSFRRMMALGAISYLKRGHWVRVRLSSLNAFIASGERPARVA
jgi:hypothetical protein